MRQSPRLAARMSDIEQDKVLRIFVVDAFWPTLPSGIAFRHVPEEFPRNPLLKNPDPFPF